MSSYMWKIPYAPLLTAFVWCVNTPTNLPTIWMVNYLIMSCPMFHHLVWLPMAPQLIPIVLFHHGLLQTCWSISWCIGSTLGVTRGQQERQRDWFRRWSVQWILILKTFLVSVFILRTNFLTHQKNRHYTEKQTPYSRDGWKEPAVEIDLPTGVRGSETETEKISFTVSGLHHWSLLLVLKSAIIDPCTASWLHFSPSIWFWVKPSGLKVQCIDEVYTSDAQIDAHNELQKQPNELDTFLKRLFLCWCFGPTPCN